MAPRGQLPTSAGAWLPCDPGDLIGPGIAVDETAQLKHGDATACVAPTGAANSTPSKHRSRPRPPRSTDT
jgi:hypothetical protein